MKVSKLIQQAARRAKATHRDLAERLKIRFAVALEQRRRAIGLSYTDLADRIEASPAYVTKVFRGDSNLTIETMAKLAFATESHLEIRLVDIGTARLQWSVPPYDHRQQLTSAGTVTELSAANSNRFKSDISAHAA